MQTSATQQFCALLHNIALSAAGSPTAALEQLGKCSKCSSVFQLFVLLKMHCSMHCESALQCFCAQVSKHSRCQWNDVALQCIALPQSKAVWAGGVLVSKLLYPVPQLGALATAPSCLTILVTTGCSWLMQFSSFLSITVRSVVVLAYFVNCKWSHLSSINSSYFLSIKWKPSSGRISPYFPA